LADGIIPLSLGAHLAEPERVSPALERPDRVNPAALIIEPTGAVRLLCNGETRCNRPQMLPGQILHGHLQEIRQKQDFPLADADEAWIPCAADAAALAFKANSGIKKIPAVILFVRVAIHMGFDL
jgi:hypothetical protein